MNDLLLRACRGEPVPRPPVWFMRQAGRYLPEYRAVRARHDFLTMVRTPALAAEVTRQPVDLLGVDAAIIFSDILIVPEAMGLRLTVEDHVGPRFTNPIAGPADLRRLRIVDPGQDLGYVLEAIRQVRRALDGRAPVIGFAGAPWTLAAYMIEGGGSKEFRTARRMVMQEPETVHELLGRLAEATGKFLLAQVDAGAQVVQVFDSWAGVLGPAEWREFALPYLARTVALARGSGVPVIVFAPGRGQELAEIAGATGAEVIGLDWQTPAGEARGRLQGHQVTLQGNLDPAVLYAPPKEIRARTRAMLTAFGPHGYIANLGHGVLRDTPVEHAREFVQTVRTWEP